MMKRKDNTFLFLSYKKVHEKIRVFLKAIIDEHTYL